MSNCTSRFGKIILSDLHKLLLPVFTAQWPTCLIPNQQRSQHYLSGGANWKNLPDFGLFFLIFPPFFPIFPLFFPIFDNFFACQGGTLPCPYTGYATVPNEKGKTCWTKLAGKLCHERNSGCTITHPPYMVARWPPRPLPHLDVLGSYPPEMLHARPFALLIQNLKPISC